MLNIIKEGGGGGGAGEGRVQTHTDYFCVQIASLIISLLFISHSSVTFCRLSYNSAWALQSKIDDMYVILSFI